MSASFVGRLSLSNGNNPRKPFSAAYQPKRPPGSGGNRTSIAAQISSAANDHVVVINEEDDEQQQQQNVFHVDNANGKHGKPCLTGTVRSGTREMYLLISVLVLMTVWLIVLTVFVVRSQPSPPPPPPAGAAGAGAGGGGTNSIVPILDRLRDPSHFKFPFILQPDDNTNGRLQTVQPPENFTVENILSYDVCCMQASFYVCRNLPGIKNIGVDAYFDVVNKRLVVQVIHADMVGAKCHLLWNVK